MSEVTINNSACKVKEDGSLEFKGGNIIENVESGDDKGLRMLQELNVGSPENPSELVVGEGDSYPIDTAFHCDIANTSGLTITSATDVTTILQSDNSSTTGLFGGTTAGKYILAGSDYPFGGVKAKIDTLGNVEPDNVIGEYLFNDSPTWLTAPYMVTDAEFPLTQKANEIASCSSCSEQWRFGFNPDFVPTPWNQVTLNINGQDVTKYWARFRIVTAITADPSIEQLKQHTNRWECNADGTTEYFGRARYPRELTLNWKSTTSITGVSPLGEDITFANNLTLEYLSNEWRNNTTDGRGGVIHIPIGLDTSIIIKFEILWKPLSNNSGDIDFELLISQKQIGDKLDASTTATSSIVTTDININELDVLKRTELTFLANRLKPGEILGFGIQRLGSLDDYSDNIAIIDISAEGYFWRP